MIGCLPTQALAFLAVFVYATHATQATAFEWKPGLNQTTVWLQISTTNKSINHRKQTYTSTLYSSVLQTNLVQKLLHNLHTGAWNIELHTTWTYFLADDWNETDLFQLRTIEDLNVFPDMYKTINARRISKHTKANHSNVSYVLYILYIYIYIYIK